MYDSHLQPPVTLDQYRTALLQHHERVMAYLDSNCAFEQGVGRILLGLASWDKIDLMCAVVLHGSR